MKVILIIVIFFNCLLNFLSANNTRKGYKENYIANGQQARWSEFPYIVKIASKNIKYICSGVIIHPRWIATVKSCIWEMNPGHVYFNIDNTLYAGPHIEIETIKPSKKKNTTEKDYWKNDMGLVRLKSAINIAGIHASKLVGPSTVLKINMRAVIAGWGYTEGSKRFSIRLLKADTKLQPFKKCHYNMTQSKSALCAGDANSNVCIGDGGTPLIVKGKNPKEDIIIGLASTAVSTCHRKYAPSIFVNIQYYLQWIKKVLKEYKDVIN